MAVAVLHPFSRGSVHIASPNPLTHPAIDGAYLRQPADVDLLVEALRFARGIYASERLKPLVKGEDVGGPGGGVVFPEGMDAMTAPSAYHELGALHACARPC